MSLDDQIGELYALPLGEFVAARTALAKTLTGDSAKRVKALAKPTVVPWAVNQVYWHARPAFDKVLKTGTALHRAQIAALEGRKADIRTLTTEHRAAIAAAVREATTRAEREGASPGADALSRLFEAISLNDEPGEPHGRLTRPVGPAGFEALLGVAVKAPLRREDPPAPAPVGRKLSDADRKREEARRAQLEKEQAAEARRRQQAIDKAEKAVAAAKAEEQDARREWEAAEERLAEARHALEKLRFGKA